MHARGEDTLYSLARHHGMEDGPDSIVRGGDYLDMRSEVTCGAG